MLIIYALVKWKKNWSYWIDWRHIDVFRWSWFLAPVLKRLYTSQFLGPLLNWICSPQRRFLLRFTHLKSNFFFIIMAKWRHTDVLMWSKFLVLLLNWIFPPQRRFVQYFTLFESEDFFFIWITWRYSDVIKQTKFLAILKSWICTS